MTNTDLETRAGVGLPALDHALRAKDEQAFVGRPSPQWKPLDGLGRWVVRGLVAQAALLVVLWYAGLNTTALAADGERAFTVGQANFAFVWLIAAGVPAVVASLTTAALFLAWFRRAYRNLWPLEASGMRSPGWAIGAWFVPVANLVLPKRMADEVWRGSKPDTIAHNVRRSSGASSSRLVTVWWSLLLSSSVLPRLETMFLAAETQGSSLVVMSLLGGALTAGSLVSFALVVTRITDRQHARARLLGLEPATPDWRAGWGTSNHAAGVSGAPSPPAVSTLGVRLVAAVVVGLLATGPVAAASLSAGDGEQTIGQIEDDLAATNTAAEAARQDEQTLIAVDKACADFATAVSELGEPEDLPGVARFFTAVIEHTATRDAAIASAQFASPEFQSEFAAHFQQPVLADTVVMETALRPVLDAAHAGDGHRARTLLESYPEAQGTIDSAVRFAEEQGMYACAAIFRPPRPQA